MMPKDHILAILEWFVAKLCQESRVVIRSLNGQSEEGSSREAFIPINGRENSIKFVNFLLTIIRASIENIIIATSHRFKLSRKFLYHESPCIDPPLLLSLCISSIT